MVEGEAVARGGAVVDGGWRLLVVGVVRVSRLKQGVV